MYVGGWVWYFELHWSTKFNFCHGSKTKWSVSGVICGAEHEFGAAPEMAYQVRFLRCSMHLCRV